MALIAPCGALADSEKWITPGDGSKSHVEDIQVPRAATPLVECDQVLHRLKVTGTSSWAEHTHDSKCMWIRAFDAGYVNQS